MPARQLLASSVIATIIVLLSTSHAAGAAQEGPRSVEIGDPVVTAMIARHTRAYERIEKRTERIEAARARVAKKRPRAPATGKDDPAAPRKRLEWLRADVAFLGRLAVWERRRLAAAIDADHAVRNALRETDAMIAKRKRLKRPSRGPLALGDPTLAALREYRGTTVQRRKVAADTVAIRRAELDAFVEKQGARTEALEKTERALEASRRRVGARDEEAKRELGRRRGALAAREEALMKEATALRVEAKRERATLLAILRPDTEGNGADLPMAKLYRNVTAQSAFRQTLRHRARLVEIRRRQREVDLRFAEYHADRAKYLEAVRASGVRLPATASLDPAVALRDAREARRRARGRQTRVKELEAEAKRTEAVIAGLAAEAQALAAAWRSGRTGRSDRTRVAPSGRGTAGPIRGRSDRTRVGFARLPRREPLARAPDLPESPSAAVLSAHREVIRAKREREAARKELFALGETWRETVARAVERATSIATHPADQPGYGRWVADFDRARHDLERQARESHALAERYMASRRSLERRLAELSLAIDRAPPPARSAWRTAWRDRWLPGLRRSSARLPLTPVLIGLTALLLAIGTWAGRLRRMRALGFVVHASCLGGALALAGVGALRGGPAGTALASTGALGAFLLLGAFPVNLFAGVTMLLSGEATPGSKISNGAVEGRVIRRGLLATRVVVSDGAGRTEVKLGNASLLQAAPAKRLTTGAAIPPPQSVTARVTVDSDWMAVRELAERIADREIVRPRVRFHVEADGIRLVLRGAEPFDADAVGRRLARAIDRAPFARRLPTAKATGDAIPLAPPENGP